MGIGTASDFVVYQEEFNSGKTEVMQQAVNVFNEDSAGTILLGKENHIGDYSSEAFFQDVVSVDRRDTTSTSAKTATALTQTEDVKVKLNRSILVEQTVDAFKKIGRDPREMSFLVGQQAQARELQDYLNTAVVAADNAIGQDLSVDLSSGTMNHDALSQGIALFGDKGTRVKAFVMHSKVYYDLVGQSIADKITNVADLVIHSGVPATLGRPVILSDVSGLIDSGSPDKYHTLALTSNAITIEESEDSEFLSERVGGLDNLVLRLQTESAWTLGVKGYAWDIANGGRNPTSATLNTATNWDKVASDDKSLAGSQIITL